jgi:hypothetical protein
MNSINCVICQKAIKDFDHYLTVGYGIPLPLYSICDRCGQPIIAFLQEHGLSSFTDQQRITWKANPEATLAEVLNLNRKRGGSRRGKGRATE